MGKNDDFFGVDEPHDDRYWDPVCMLPTEGSFDDPIDEAKYLGNVKAGQVNKLNWTDVYSSTEENRIKYADERIEALAGMHGQAVRDAFDAAYEETFDPSANSDWRFDPKFSGRMVEIHYGRPDGTDNPRLLDE